MSVCLYTKAPNYSFIGQRREPTLVFFFFFHAVDLLHGLPFSVPNPNLYYPTFLSWSYYEIAPCCFTHFLDLSAISFSLSSPEIHHNRFASLPALPFYFSSTSSFPFSLLPQQFSLHIVRVYIAISYEIIDENLSNNSIDSLSHRGINPRSYRLRNLFFPFYLGTA